MKYLRLIFQYFKTNLAMQMEYRFSFIVRVLGMMLNDGMWVLFWTLYFARFPAVRGWTREDVVTLWAVCALGFGIAHLTFGNLLGVAKAILQGELDMYLVYPGNPLVHLLASKTDPTAAGDVLFGTLVFFLFTRPNIVQALLFLLAGILTVGIFVGFGTLAGCLAFYIGNSEMLASQVYGSLIHFATYPSTIFSGAIKFILFTVLPAGFINSVPVRIVREFDPLFFAAFTGVCLGLPAMANYVFRLGLKRYESGNLLQARV